MPRAQQRVITEAKKDEVSPVLLVMILNIPEALDSSVKHSLYLTDCDYDAGTGSHTDIWWFNELGGPKLYQSCGIKFESVEVSTDTEFSTCSLAIDNVDRTFSALAQYGILNGAEVRVFRGYRDLLDYPDGAQTLFVGHLKKVVVSEHAIKGDVWADFSLKMKVPRRMYSVNLFPYIPASKDVRETFRG